MKDGFRRLIPILLVALLAFAGGTLAVGGGTTVLHANAKAGATVDADQAATTSPSLGNPYLIADVAERVTPAVVFIEAKYPPQKSEARNPFSDPFFRDFFFPFNPWPDQPQGPQIARGTGFIIDGKEGYVLTNQHVVGSPGDGQEITVKIDTGDYQGDVKAKLLGADYQLDLAVLKIEKPAGLDELPAVPLGDSEKSRVGEWVIAVGNPYGEQFEHTVTVGVLSAKGREIKIYDRERGQAKTYSNLMQTDAAINPGNSGGPLINIEGKVIGINTAVNAQAQGIGFAIPISTALEVKDQLIEKGKVVREDEGQGAFLGVELSDISQRVAGYLGLPNTKGSLIVGVVDNSAAQKAGLQVYDVIQRVGNTQIESTDALIKEIDKHKPGDKLLLLVWRQGRKLVVPAVLGQKTNG